MGRMFEDVDGSWNPLVGCRFGCVYCWARRLCNTRLRRYYGGFGVRYVYDRLNRVPKSGCRFVCSISDLFAPWVSSEFIERVFKAIIRSGSRATFLFLTKNPLRYLEFEDLFRENMVFGATVESNKVFYAVDGGVVAYDEISGAPDPISRIYAMYRLPSGARRFISIEPVLQFSIDFPEMVRDIRPEVVYVGYDNYGWRLPEPSLAEFWWLVGRLRELGVRVKLKTVRRAWWEDE